MAEIWQRTQKEWIKTLWKAYKPPAAGAGSQPTPSGPGNEVLWSRVSDMVGYFNSDLAGSALAVGLDGRPRDLVPVGADCTLSPLRPTSAAAEPGPGSSDDPSVRRLVCSPDLPVFSITPTAAAGSVPAKAAPAMPSVSAPEPELADSSTSPLSYACSICNKSFNQKAAFQNHMRTHGKVGEDPYQCNICGKTFAVPARLTRHNRTHTGEKPYQCEYCNKSFSVKENLSVHRRIHTKERPYKCEICERAFEHSGKLHRHMRIHTGERPHKCNICSKTFIQSGQLVIHMRTHTGEKPYVCKICGKGFTCSKQLKVHNRTHTGEKPYSCDICGKSFGYNHVLKLHQVAHYGEKVYKCTICNHTFTSKKTMEMHIKSHAEPSPATMVSDVSESCASSSSDKENKADSDVELAMRSQPVHDTRQTSPSPRPSPSPSAMSPPGHPATHSSQAPSHQYGMQQHHMEYQDYDGERHHQHQQQQQQQHYEDEQRSQQQPSMRELCYYLYPKPTASYQPMTNSHNGVNPLLLAAAAAAAERDARSSPTPSNSSLTLEIDEGLSPEPEADSRVHRDGHRDGHRDSQRDALPVTEPDVCLVPETLSRYTFSLPPPPEYLEEPTEMMRLPLSPSPVSPASSPSSPDPIDLAIGRNQINEMNLPPRKRSRMIQKSMESDVVAPQLRYSSVIQFARAGK